MLRVHDEAGAPMASGAHQVRGARCLPAGLRGVDESPAPEPRYCSNAGPKSPLDRPQAA